MNPYRVLWAIAMHIHISHTRETRHTASKHQKCSIAIRTHFAPNYASAYKTQFNSYGQLDVVQHQIYPPPQLEPSAGATFAPHEYLPCEPFRNRVEREDNCVYDGGSHHLVWFIIVVVHCHMCTIQYVCCNRVCMQYSLIRLAIILIRLRKLVETVKGIMALGNLNWVAR